MHDFYKNLELVKKLSKELVDAMNDSSDNMQNEDILALNIIQNCKMMDIPLEIFITDVIDNIK